MNIFDILGPVMVGPSSSHTAGAVRIGYVSRLLLGAVPDSAEIYLHGSFADTGVGHGTDRALVAGLLGMDTDDMEIPNSFEVAKRVGMSFTIDKIQLEDVHPNSVMLKLKKGEHELKVVASSLGGGRISIVNIDDVATDFTGEYPTLIVHHLDRPGLVAQVTSSLAEQSVNIAALNLYRSKRGGYAVMIVETDQPIPQKSIELFEQTDGVQRVTYLNTDKEGLI
jgi:L-serine dehydratase